VILILAVILVLAAVALEIIYLTPIVKHDGAAPLLSRTLLNFLG